MTDLLRMVQQHVDSLRAAGVEWIEAAQATGEIVGLESPAPNPQPPTPDPHRSSTSLFDQPSSVPAMTSEQKRFALQVLNEEQVVGCTRCPELVRNRKQTVFARGNPAADLCFVGEAPGADEDAQGAPFVGPAGKLLDKIIAACKLTQDEVYICNVLKCRPPGNRTPLPDEVANCRPFLEQQLSILQPKYICALGAVGAQWLLNTTQSIGKLRGRFHDYRGIPVLCTYHPAYLLRNPAAKRDVWDDMKKLMARMGRPVE